MLISKFDLYKTEWLDLVFAKRNKEYGAYYLRQHYAGNLIKAMGITFVTITGAAIIYGIAIKAKPADVIRIIDVDNFTYVPPVPPKAEPKKAEPLAAKPSAPVKTTKYVEMIVTPDAVAVEPPKYDKLLETAVGPTEVNTPGSGTAINIDPVAGNGGAGTEVAPAESNEVHNAAGLEVMPAPFGGEAGWTKFLQKNLHYPPIASENAKSGKVWISFIIEKDGHLSDITLLRGPGFGMDEEAMRVLKIAPAWKPGKQNGQPVRVKYTIPINFSIGE